MSSICFHDKPELFSASWCQRKHQLVLTLNVFPLFIHHRPDCHKSGLFYFQQLLLWTIGVDVAAPLGRYRKLLMLPKIKTNNIFHQDTLESVHVGSIFTEREQKMFPSSFFLPDVLFLSAGDGIMYYLWALCFLSSFNRVTLSFDLMKQMQLSYDLNGNVSDSDGCRRFQNSRSSDSLSLLKKRKENIFKLLWPETQKRR